MIRYQKDLGLRFVNYDTSADCGKVILANPYVDLLDGQWYFVAFVNSEADGLMHLYVNGIHIMSVSNAELNIGNNEIPLMSLLKKGCNCIESGAYCINFMLF